MAQSIMKLLAAGVLLFALLATFLPKPAQSSTCCNNCQSRYNSCVATCDSNYTSCAMGCPGCPF